MSRLSRSIYFVLALALGGLAVVVAPHTASANIDVLSFSFGTS